MHGSGKRLFGLSSVALAVAMAMAVLVCSAEVGFAQEGSVSMWRLYNPYTGEHLYSSSQHEYDELGGVGWKQEGVVWMAPKTSAHTVYRLYNSYSGDHHYTTSSKEYEDLGKAGWRQEGAGWYSDEGHTVSVYRLFNPYAKVGTHHYTTDAHEYDALAVMGWKQEGVAWYGLAQGGTDANLAAPSTTGALRVQGGQLVSQQGTPVQLRGVSTHGLAWFPEYVNDACFSQLRHDWGANVVRLALYTEEYGGYCSGGNQEELTNLIRRGVKVATQNDMYVIVDWHILYDGNPLWHVSEAKSFFSKISAEFANNSNVLYEICNEPNGETSWGDIKQYANEVIPTIRQNDADAIILVGTPTWSQEIDTAAADPLGFNNVMYTLHFYAATHTDELRNRLVSTVQGGLPVFVSEFGICDASGNGWVDEASANKWLSVMNDLRVSWCMWSLCNKAEYASIVASDCTKTSGFSEQDLAQSGQWLVHALK